MISDKFIRIHKIWLFIEFVKVIRNCILIYFFLLFLKTWFFINDITVYIILSIIFIYSSLSLYLYWKNFRVFLLKNKIKIQKGTYIKNIVHLNHDKIAGINEKNNILEKLFHLNSMVVKVNSIDKDESIVIPTLSEKDSKKIKKALNLIIDKKTKNIENVYFKPNILDIFKNSLSSFNIIVFFIFLYSIYSTISDYINIDWLLVIVKNYSLNNTFSIILSIISILVITYIYTLIKSLLNYKNFTLINNQKNLIINYGIISRVKMTISKPSISAIIIKSTAIQNLLNFEEIRVISMNPKENNTIEEEAILPISKKGDAVKHLQNLLEYNIERDSYQKINSSVLLLKCIRKSCYFSLSIPFLIILNNFYLTIFIACLYLYSIIYQFIYVLFTSYSFSGNTFNFKKKSINIEHIIIPYDDMEEIIIKQSPVQKLFRVGTITIVNKAIPPKKFKFFDISLINLLEIKKNFIKINKKRVDNPLKKR